MVDVTVIGCGISGLSCGLMLIRDGYRVAIVAKDLPPFTTSDKAAAFWSPYYANGDRVARWARESYFVYEKLTMIPLSGVSMAKLHRFRKKEHADAENWETALPEGKYRPLKPDQIPKQYDEGFEVDVPLIETQIFLPYLMNEFRNAGGTIEQREVNNAEEFLSSGALLVNCTGMGARTLVNDDSMIPVKGQIIKVDVHLNIPIILVESEPTYIVQRRDGCILGGTREENIFTESTDEETLSAILDRTSKFYPELKSAKRITEWAGLRPYRSEVRVEREGNIIHNYGHGGSGFTLSWGCANEVLRLVKQ